MIAKFLNVDTIIIELNGIEAERILLDNFLKNVVRKGVYISGSGSLDGKTNTMSVSVKPD